MLACSFPSDSPNPAPTQQKMGTRYASEGKRAYPALNKCIYPYHC